MSAPTESLVPLDLIATKISQLAATASFLSLAAAHSHDDDAEAAFELLSRDANRIADELEAIITQQRNDSRDGGRNDQ